MEDDLIFFVNQRLNKIINKIMQPKALKMKSMIIVHNQTNNPKQLNFFCWGGISIGKKNHTTQQQE
jgi:hypothetical protein